MKTSCVFFFACYSVQCQVKFAAHDLGWYGYSHVLVTPIPEANSSVLAIGSTVGYKEYEFLARTPGQFCISCGTFIILLYYYTSIQTSIYISEVGFSYPLISRILPNHDAQLIARVLEIKSYNFILYFLSGMIVLPNSRLGCRLVSVWSCLHLRHISPVQTVFLGLCHVLPILPVVQ